MLRACLLVAAIAALSGCAATPGTTAATQEPRACFWASEVTSFSDAGQDRALVKIGRRETWELALSPGCPDVDWAMRLGIRSRGGERICSGANAELLVPGASGSGVRRCLVRDVRRVAPEASPEAPGEG
jgi:hypothetical protein